MLYGGGELNNGDAFANLTRAMLRFGVGSVTVQSACAGHATYIATSKGATVAQTQVHADP